MGKNKRPKSYYLKLSKRQKTHHNILSSGLKGFLCTSNDREKECVREAYNILNEYANQLYGKEDMQVAGGKISPSKEESKLVEATDEAEKKLTSEEKEDNPTDIFSCKDEQKSSEATQERLKEQPDNYEEEKVKDENTSPNKKQDHDEGSSDSDEESISIDAAIKADVDKLKKENDKKNRSLRRFSQVATGAKSYVFIRSTLDDPLPLSLMIMDDILKQQQQKTKNLIRMIPVQSTCKAFQDDIVKGVKNMCASYFKEKGKSFYIAIKIKNNNSVEKEALKLSLITVVSDANSANTPELKDPEIVVNIDVIKNVCCMSLLPGYFTKYCKYNLLSLSKKRESKDTPKTEGSNDVVSEKEAT